MTQACWHISSAANRRRRQLIVILIGIFCFSFRSKIVELEEELRVVGNNLKSLEVSEEKVKPCVTRFQLRWNILSKRFQNICQIPLQKSFPYQKNSFISYHPRPQSWIRPTNAKRSTSSKSRPSPPVSRRFVSALTFRSLFEPSFRCALTLALSPILSLCD